MVDIGDDVTVRKYWQWLSLATKGLIGLGLLALVVMLIMTALFYAGYVDRSIAVTATAVSFALFFVGPLPLTMLQRRRERKAIIRRVREKQEGF
jgi:hypothetical protein